MVLIIYYKRQMLHLFQRGERKKGKKRTNEKLPETGDWSGAELWGEVQGSKHRWENPSIFLYIQFGVAAGWGLSQLP